MILHDITDNNFDDNIKGDKTLVDFLLRGVDLVKCCLLNLKC